MDTDVVQYGDKAGDDSRVPPGGRRALSDESRRRGSEESRKRRNQWTGLSADERKRVAAARKPYRLTPTLLRDMRKVYRFGASRRASYTEGQKRCLELMESDSEAFLRQLAQLESADRTAKLKEGDGRVPMWDGVNPCPSCKRGPEMVDQGTERIMPLIQKLLENGG